MGKKVLLLASQPRTHTARPRLWPDGGQLFRSVCLFRYMWQSFHHIGALHFVYLHRPTWEENTARVKVLAGALEAGKEGLYRNQRTNEMCKRDKTMLSRVLHFRALSANNGNGRSLSVRPVQWRLPAPSSSAASTKRGSMRSVTWTRSSLRASGLHSRNAPGGRR